MRLPSPRGHARRGGRGGGVMRGRGRGGGRGRGNRMDAESLTGKQVMMYIDSNSFGITW